MLFSIIVPVYNVKEYIHRCLDSLMNQTYKKIEVIIVDDGSTDNSSRICDEYCEKDSRFLVIHKKNEGLSEARNVGLLKASGKYVLFVDSDDAIAEDAVERFFNYTTGNYDIIVGDGIVSGGRACFLHNIPKGDYTGEKFLREAHLGKTMPMAAVLNLYSREFLIENSLFFKKGIYHEDENFTPKAFLKAKKVLNSKIDFYYYFIREGSITTKRDLSKNAKDMYDTCLELLEIYKKLEDLKLKRLLIDSLVEKYLNIFFVGRIYQYGKSYIHKKFVINNARLFKTKVKALIFCISCRFYCFLNSAVKKCSRKSK